MGLFNVQNAFICLHSFIHFPCVCQSFHLILIIQGVRQGTSYSCFTYKETQAQEGELFTQSHIITGRTGTWIKFSWLPVPGCLRLLSNYFNAFTGKKKSWFGQWQSSTCFFAGLYIKSHDKRYRCKFSASDSLHFCL